nr:ATP synthase F0 subunit 8 [Tetanops sintenisi]
MPQMAPIGWLSLFMMFSIIFILFNIMNYYTAIPSTPKSSLMQKSKTSSLNWKW